MTKESGAGMPVAGRDVPTDAEGGEAACWADRLCHECGIVEDGSPHREGCSRQRTGTSGTEDRRPG